MHPVSASGDVAVVLGWAITISAIALLFLLMPCVCERDGDLAGPSHSAVLVGVDHSLISPLLGMPVVCVSSHRICHRAFTLACCSCALLYRSRCKSSIVFTSLAADVRAILSASASSLVAIFMTPIWVSAFCEYPGELLHAVIAHGRSFPCAIPRAL